MQYVIQPPTARYLFSVDSSSIYPSSSILHMFVQNFPFFFFGLTLFFPFFSWKVDSNPDSNNFCFFVSLLSCYQTNLNFIRKLLLPHGYFWLQGHFLNDIYSVMKDPEIFDVNYTIVDYSFSLFALLLLLFLSYIFYRLSEQVRF